MKSIRDFRSFCSNCLTYGFLRLLAIVLIFSPVYNTRCIAFNILCRTSHLYSSRPSIKISIYYNSSSDFIY